MLAQAIAQSDNRIPWLRFLHSGSNINSFFIELPKTEASVLPRTGSSWEKLCPTEPMMMYVYFVVVNNWLIVE